MEGSDSPCPVLSSSGAPDATTDAGVGNLGGGYGGELRLCISQVLVLRHRDHTLPQVGMEGSTNTPSPPSCLILSLP